MSSAVYCFQMWLWDPELTWCSAQLWKGYDSGEVNREEIIFSLWAVIKALSKTRGDRVRSETPSLGAACRNFFQEEESFGVEKKESLSVC